MTTHSQDSLTDIKARLSGYLAELGAELRFKGEDRFTCKCPLHDDRSPSFTANLKDGVWQWFCHPCGVGGTLIDLHGALHNLSAADSIRELREKYESGASLPPALMPLRKATPPPAPMSTPLLYRGGTAHLHLVANLRKLPVRAIEHADALGWLRFTEFQGQPCFVLKDHAAEGKLIQLRRLDGQPINSAKAHNWPGSRLVPIGSNHLKGDDMPVMLVEGAVGILELLALCFHSPHKQTRHDWAMLAMASASSRLSDSLLDKLRGRTVRIMGDADSAGDRATGMWADQLQGVASRIQRVNLRKLPMLANLPKADLGDLLALPESREKHQILDALTNI